MPALHLTFNFAHLLSNYSIISNQHWGMDTVPLFYSPGFYCPGFLIATFWGKYLEKPKLLADFAKPR